MDRDKVLGQLEKSPIHLYIHQHIHPQGNTSEALRGLNVTKCHCMYMKCIWSTKGSEFIYSKHNTQTSLKRFAGCLLAF